MRRTLQWFFIFLFLLAVGIASGSFLKSSYMAQEKRLLQKR